MEAAMKRRRRRWPIVLLLTAVLLLIGVRLFLSSSYVAGRAAASLEKLYGGTVRVGGADIGLGGTVLTGVELFEKNDGPQQQPWLTVDRLETDLSLGDVLGGRDPTRVVLKGVTVRLRFDADGRLLTRLPAPAQSSGGTGRLPEVELVNGRVLLLGTSDRQVAFDHVAATLKPQAGKNVLAGTGQNAAWGSWTVAGTLDLAQDTVKVLLNSNCSVHVTQGMLRALPLVPASVWDDVELEGDTPVSVALSHRGAAGGSSRVTLAPTHTHLRIPAIDLDTTQTRGTVEMLDGKIELRKVQGQFAGGTLTADIDLTFPERGLHIDIRALTAEQIDVQSLPRRWSLPPALAGRLHAVAELQVELTGGKVFARGSGKGEVVDATFAGQPLRGPLDLHLDDLHGATRLLIDGEIPGANLEALARGIDVQLPAGVDGRLEADFHAALPLATIGDPRTYQASGRAALSPLRAVGVTVDHARATWVYEGGTMHLRGLRAVLPGGPLTGSATIRLEAPYTLVATLQAADVDLAVLGQLDAGLRPPFVVEGRLTGRAELHGTLRPFALSTAGTATVTRLRASDWAADSLSARWHSGDQKVQFESIDAAAYGGRATGGVTLPLGRGAAGQFQFRLDGIDIGRVTRERLGLAMRFDGKAAGTVTGTIAPQAADRPRDLSCHLDLHAQHLDIDRGKFEQATLTADYRKGTLLYRAGARAFGGTVELQGGHSFAEQAQAHGLRPGHLRLHRIDVPRLLGSLGERAQTPLPVRGALDAELRFRFAGQDALPVARGHITVTDLAWQDQRVAAVVQTELTLLRNELALRDLSATVAGGVLTGKVVLNLEHQERSWCQLALDGAELADLLRPWPALAEQCQGTCALRLQGRLGQEWHGSADAVLTRGKLAGVAVTEWRLPARWALAPADGRGQLEIHESTAQVAQGNASAQLSVAWGAGLRLDGQMKFHGVDLRQALPGAKLGNGRANGQLDVSGDSVRSLDDVKATLNANFVQTQAMQLPVLRQVAPVLGFSTASTFQNGELRARLAKGIVRVERLTFYQGPLQLYAEGNVTLEGRVQLDVTANTGKLTNVTAALGWRVPASGGIGRELLTKATTALSPRLVHLRVTGTVREPTIQVVPLPLLTEQALRFFASF
jgi:hypothetical protein